MSLPPANAPLLEASLKGERDRSALRSINTCSSVNADLNKEQDPYESSYDELGMTASLSCDLLILWLSLRCRSK